jgi:hypothetical protein
MLLCVDVAEGLLCVGERAVAQAVAERLPIVLCVTKVRLSACVVVCVPVVGWRGAGAVGDGWCVARSDARCLARWQTVASCVSGRSPAIARPACASRAAHTLSCALRRRDAEHNAEGPVLLLLASHLFSNVNGASRLSALPRQTR